MSTTTTQSVTATGLLHVPEAELRNYSLNEAAQKKSLGDILSILVCDSPEDLLALLSADPPAKDSVETETTQNDRSLANAKEPVFGDQPEAEKVGKNMERVKIAALKRMLHAQLDDNKDYEMFKSSRLNVAKYVVGPVPVNTARKSDVAVDVAMNRLALEDAQWGTGSNKRSKAGDAVGTPAMSNVAGSHIEDGDGEDVFEHVNGSLVGTIEGANTESVDTQTDEHIEETVPQIVEDIVEQAVVEISAEIETDNAQAVLRSGIDDGKHPRVPPNTPAKEERIWWRNDFFIVKKSALGGLGAFAAKDLDEGQTILEELPLLRTNIWDFHNQFESLNDEDMELLFSLHKYHPNPEAHVFDKIRKANSFQVTDGVTIYSVTSRFNHACLPVRNVSYEIDERRDGKIALTMLEDVAKGTELTICYGGTPESLLKNFGFRCQCGGCTPLTDDEVEKMMLTSQGQQHWTNMW